MANYMNGVQLRQYSVNAMKLGFRRDKILQWDDRLTQWSESERTPSIAVKVLRHGQVAFEGAYGTIGPGKEPDSLTLDTIFPVSSITKPVVSTLLAIMQEEGLVDFYHPVRQYIPEFTGDKNGSIRIWHLLTHSSGLVGADLYRYFKDYVVNTLGMSLPSNDDSEETWNEIYLKIREMLNLPNRQPSEAMRADTYLQLCLTAPPTYKPHEIMSYCGTGYELALEIVKRVSGKSADDYAKEKLFGPLKMKDSHFILPKEKWPRTIQRGKEAEGADYYNEGVLNSESGAGGLKTTVNDIARFGQMFLNKGILDGVRILSPVSVKTMTTDHNTKLPMAEYNGQVLDSTWGLGWNVKANKEDDSGYLRSSVSFEHGGAGGTRILVDPSLDLVIAYFSVYTEEKYWNVSCFNNMVISSIEDI